MTVCAPNSEKWPALVEAIHYYDTNAEILQAAEKINEELTYVYLGLTAIPSKRSCEQSITFFLNLANSSHIY